MPAGRVVDRVASAARGPSFKPDKLVRQPGEVEKFGGAGIDAPAD